MYILYVCVNVHVIGYIMIVDTCTCVHVYTCISCTCVCNVGVDCVIVKSGRRICGTGAALANAPLVQDKSYFEIKIQCGG